MDSYEIDKILMKNDVDKKQLIEIMYTALGIMQYYNGDTVDFCVKEAMKANDLIHSSTEEKDEIKFGIGRTALIVIGDAALYVSYKDIHKEFGIGSDSWKIVSFIFNSYRKLYDKQFRNDFVIDIKHGAYPILKHLIDSNTIDDEITDDESVYK